MSSSGSISLPSSSSGDLLLGDHRDGVRQLVAGDPQQLLAHQLGHEEGLGLVGDHTARVVLRPLGQPGLELADERVDALAGEAGERHVGVERRRAPPRRRPDAPPPSACSEMSTLFTTRIFGVSTSARSPAMKRSPGPIRAVASTSMQTTSTSPSVERARCVGALAEQRARPVDARRVEQDDLRRRGGAHAPDLGAGGLRAVGDDRDLGAHELVHQRGLADVRPAHEGHEAGTEDGCGHGIPIRSGSSATEAPATEASSAEPVGRPVGGRRAAG